MVEPSPKILASEEKATIRIWDMIGTTTYKYVTMIGPV